MAQVVPPRAVSESPVRVRRLELGHKPAGALVVAFVLVVVILS